MFIAWGERMYGKVDHVPGLFYVGTRFFYFQYIPIFPINSAVIIDGTENDKGYQGKRIGLSLKSILTTWIRTALMLAGATTMFIGICEMLQPGRDRGYGAGLFCTGVCLLLLFWLSYRFTRAGVHRALALATELGIPPERVAQVFAANGRLPKGDVD